MPDPDYLYQFTSHDALNKSPFICYFDFEAKLTPTDSSCKVKNAYHKHEAIAGEYVIIDRDGKIAVRKKVIGGDNIGARLQQSILDEYRKLYRKFRESLYSKAVLTREDFIKHINTK